jgi:subtilisin family serine protease
MMSSSPPADFVLDYFTDIGPPTYGPVSPHSIARFSGSLAPLSLADAHTQTGLAAARAAYGLTGRGQTVAVIDTGIAFTHNALGGGWGARVVGGWDYAENDFNPFDDPAGSHGTHVAGIIGNSDAANPGVATGVDLVALRVFADNGSGYFSWVENALRWVYQNRFAFRSPITTVNISLGAVYNGTSAPLWSQLEDEFDQLESVGVFVAVAAGNDFASWRAPGLSYPAASPHVVPVSAVDAGGFLASFSQRLDRVIAAPGVSIRSTIPDYYGNQNNIGDDWASYSGTSMASPYVAGAAVLIREAMLFAGRTNITQDDIYQVMAYTADWVYDPATALNYRRLNMQRALDYIMPLDDYGSTAATARALGTIAATASFTGRIERTTDHDFFTFTAAATGTVDFAASASHYLALGWQVAGPGGTNVTHTGSGLSLNVVAGQTYTIDLRTTAGVGIYSVTATTGIASSELGMVDFREVNDQPVSGEAWYSFTTARGGALTIEALLTQAGGNVDLNVYNANYQLIATSARNGNERLDMAAAAGQRFYVQLLGTNSDVSLRIANLIGQSGSTLYIYGTAGNDTVTFSAGITHRLTLNGIQYAFNWQTISNFFIDGLGGSDTMTMNGTTILDTGVIRPAAASMFASWYGAHASRFENLTMNAGGAGDTVQFFDSPGNDQFYADPASATFTGAGVTNVAAGFGRVEAQATGGNDQALFEDSQYTDTFIASSTYAALIGPGFYNLVLGFDSTQAISGHGGSDTATLFDSAGNDLFIGRPTWARFSGAGWSNQAEGFAAVTARADFGGWDMSYFYDSAGDDSYVAGSNYAWMTSGGYRNLGLFFDLMAGFALAGNDTAQLADSINNDTLELDGSWARLNGAGFGSWANGFDRVSVSGANGGVNTITRRAAHDFVFNQLGVWS